MIPTLVGVILHFHYESDTGEMRYLRPLPALGRGCILLLLLGAAVTAPARSHEEVVAETLTERLPEEEVIRLFAEGSRFLGLYRNNRAERARGAVILVHGLGAHPDWPEVISPLRRGLPEVGWSTLSIQMPLLSPDRQLSEYGGTVRVGAARIHAALNYLLNNKQENIVIVGYGFGAAVAADYLAANRHKDLRAFVGISMQAQAFLNPRLQLPARLEKIDLPLLDIYGSRDYDEVLKQTDDRRLAGTKNDRRNYYQITVEGADHYYTDLDDVLLRQIRGWLERDKPLPGQTGAAGD